jgi:hypothetical protein
VLQQLLSCGPWSPGAKSSWLEQCEGPTPEPLAILKTEPPWVVLGLCRRSMGLRRRSNERRCRSGLVSPTCGRSYWEYIKTL